MLKTRSSSAWTPRTMYEAVRRRDASAAGLFYVAVKTTGIFCKPGCPARTPKLEHCEFFRSPGAAMQSGYRPCMRCKPLTGVGSVPAWASGLAAMLEEDPPRMITASDARKLGVHPATAARYFRKHMGATFQALSRARRVGSALAWVRRGGAVPSAAMRAGFESESGFRKAAAELFGSAGDMKEGAGGGEAMRAKWLATPLGPMVAVASERGLALLEFLDRRMLETNLRSLRRRTGRPIVPGTNEHLTQIEAELAEYFAGARSTFGVRLHVAGSEFQEMVWRELGRIPYGQTRSYQQVAKAVGKASAVRAVARANGDNRLAIVIPCHRVIGADGSLTGYGGGVDRKQRLLEIERAIPATSGLFESEGPIRASERP